MDIALECQGIDVHFGAVHALRNVSVRFARGQIHALLGQNGAGKSTIARVMSGVIAPDAGRLSILSRDVPLGDAAAIQSAGLDIVHQRFALPPTFRVAEALEFASARKMGGAIYSRRQVEQGWTERLRAAGLNVDPRARLSRLPVETAQAIEIVRAMANDARVLILDEPTALLSPEATKGLFDQMRALRDQGVTLVVILHKLKEVMAVADTVSILRRGEMVLPPTAIEELSEERIRELMIGHAEAERRPPAAGAQAPTGVSALKFERVTSAAQGAEPGLRAVDLTLHQGEILGIAGVEGNGQRALAEVFAGLQAPSEGRLTLGSRDITHHSIADRRAAGVRAVPFDRMTEGASLTLSLWENVQTWRAQSFRAGRFLWISLGRMRTATRDLLQRYGVVFDTASQQAGTLSGGNLQRVILARELSGDIAAVLAAQPTRGLDFNATDFVWQELDRVRKTGAGVILISSDLDELMGICDRIAVLRGGAVAGIFSRDFSLDEIGSAMVGRA